MGEDEPLLSHPPCKQKTRSSRCRASSYTLSCRNILAVYIFLACMAVYSMRAGLSVAIVAMVNQTFASQSSDHSVLHPECGQTADNGTTSNEGKFKWDQKTQGIILGSFFYGYLATQLPGGWLACRFGGKRVLGYGVFFTSIFTLLVPIAARCSFYLLIFVRILAGLAEGVTLPAVTVMWTRWAAPQERSKYATFSTSGCAFGTVITMAVCGYLCSLTQYDNGWPLVFYVFGALGVLWFIPWMAFVHEGPAQHPRVSAEERAYLEKAIGTTQDKVAKKVQVPWISLLTSAPFWALCVIFTIHGWGIYVFLTSLPSFFKEVLDFHIKENGLLMAIPFIAAFIVQNLSAFLSDLLTMRWSCTQVRKIFVAAAFLLAAGLLIPAGYLTCDQKTLSVFLLSISSGALAIYVPVGATNPLDLSPRFAGLLYGLANLFSNIPGVLEPYTVGVMTNHKPTRGQWRKVFFITCILYVFGAVFYALFGSATTQDWNTLEQSPPVSSEESEDNSHSANSQYIQKV